MNRRQHWIFGLAGLALIAGAPVHAAPQFADTVLAAKRAPDDAREAPRESGRQAYPEGDKRRAPKHEADEREEAQGYGYGYERRQQDHPGDAGDDRRQRRR
jgi:hypothetical protein